MKNRYFNLNLEINLYHNVLSKYTKAKYAVFTDMVENSMLDLMIISEPQPEDTFHPL